MTAPGLVSIARDVPLADAQKVPGAGRDRCDDYVRARAALSVPEASARHYRNDMVDSRAGAVIRIGEAGSGASLRPSPLPAIADDLDPMDFNAQLRLLETPKECATLFARIIAPFGFDTFASGDIDLNISARSTLHVVNWPERWSEFHRDTGLAERDPTLEALAHRTTPFTWTDLRADPAFPRIGTRTLHRAGIAGWQEGFIVPVRQAAGRVGYVSLAGSRGCTCADARKYLTLMSACLHTHVRTLVGRHGFAAPPAGLTPREIDALRLVVQGMSDGAIGQALGIASSTAHEFVEKAKRKMNVRSRAELAALAVSLAIVDI